MNLPPVALAEFGRFSSVTRISLTFCHRLTPTNIKLQKFLIFRPCFDTCRCPPIKFFAWHKHCSCILLLSSMRNTAWAISLRTLSTLHRHTSLLLYLLICVISSQHFIMQKSCLLKYLGDTHLPSTFCFRQETNARNTFSSIRCSRST